MKKLRIRYIAGVITMAAVLTVSPITSTSNAEAGSIKSQAASTVDFKEVPPKNPEDFPVVAATITNNGNTTRTAFLNFVEDGGAAITADDVKIKPGKKAVLQAVLYDRALLWVTIGASQALIGNVYSWSAKDVSKFKTAQLAQDCTNVTVVVPAVQGEVKVVYGELNKPKTTIMVSAGKVKRLPVRQDEVLRVRVTNSAGKTVTVQNIEDLC